MRDRLQHIYFDWLYDKMCGHRFAPEISYRKLFAYLHQTEFIFLIDRDENRAIDGIDMRYRFALEADIVDYYEEYLDGPCSVLEMIIALAYICEEHIMDDPAKGNRTAQWFWQMIVNLGLGGMSDEHFDKRYVIDIVDVFLHREYSPDGRGGLFTIEDCDTDLRDVEIIYQLYWYLNSINYYGGN